MKPEIIQAIDSDRWRTGCDHTPIPYPDWTRAQWFIFIEDQVGLLKKDLLKLETRHAEIYELSVNNRIRSIASMCVWYMEQHGHQNRFGPLTE